jgi:type I restriction enzyme, S subunit
LRNPKIGYKLEKTIYQQIEEIPEEWDFTKISDIGKIIGGGTPDTKKEHYWKEGNISWFTPQELTGLKSIFVTDSERKITKKGVSESSAKELPKGTLLITTRATIGNCAINEDVVCTNQGFQNVSCKNNYDVKFLMYSIKYNKRRLMQYAQGTTFLEINKTNLGVVRIPCPHNPDESKKIGEYLYNIDLLIQKQDELIEQIQNLKRFQMNMLFTKGIGHKDFEDVKLNNLSQTKTSSIPSEWSLERIDSIAQCDPEYIKDEGNIDSEIKYVDIGSIKEYTIVNAQTIPFNIRPSRAQKIIKKDDVIISTVRPYLKAFARICEESKNLVCSTGFTVIRPKNNIDSKLIFFYSQSHSFLSRLIRLMQGSNYPAVTTGMIESSLIPYPKDPKEREKIVSILSNLDEWIKKETQQMEHLNQIKTGLMQQLLTGQKRVEI